MILLSGQYGLNKQKHPKKLMQMSNKEHISKHKTSTLPYSNIENQFIPLLNQISVLAEGRNLNDNFKNKLLPKFALAKSWK